MAQNQLQSRSSLLKKYTYEPYNENYSSLYSAESNRIKACLAGSNLDIYHVGSTAIPGVGGKGIIDIAISAYPDKWDGISVKLTELEYEFRASGSDLDRCFFQREFQGRRYHVHLTEFNSKDLIQMLAFRDYLRKNPKLAEEYSQIKKQASKLALRQDTKAEMKAAYAAVKKPVIAKILAELESYNKISELL